MMTISRKWTCFICIALLSLTAGIAEAVPPQPARIGGTVTVDGIQLTQATAAGYAFAVTKQDGSAYVPAAEDLDGLNVFDWYLIDIPIYDANDQAGGANPGDTAVIHVYKDGSELTVTSPVNGHFIVGASGSTDQIDIEANTRATKGMPWLSLLLLQKKAKLNVFLDPNPVLPYTGLYPCWPDISPEWHYVAYVQETNGVRVRITHFTADFYDNNGVFLVQQVNDATDFSIWFDACGPGSEYIQPSSTACADICSTLGGIPNGSIVNTFYGTDDNGNDISASGRLWLNPSLTGQGLKESEGGFAAPEIRPR